MSNEARGVSSSLVPQGHMCCGKNLVFIFRAIGKSIKDSKQGGLHDLIYAFKEITLTGVWKMD